MQKNSSDEVIKAKGFQVVNDAGVVVAELMADQDGRPHFSLYNKDGRQQLGVFIDRRGEPHVTLFGDDMKTVITLGMGRFDEDGPSRPSLEIRDEDRTIELTTRTLLDWSSLKLEWKNNSMEIALAPDPFVVMDNEGKDRWWRP